jgi:hypothetical protein
MDVTDFLPLDFSQTLDLLASWEGAQVRTIALSQPPGKPLSHTQVVLTGPLGPLQMVDNAIDENADSVAAFSLGAAGSLYISPAGFKLTQPLPPSRQSIRLDFEHDYSIQLDRLRDP